MLVTRPTLLALLCLALAACSWVGSAQLAEQQPMQPPGTELPPLPLGNHQQLGEAASGPPQPAPQLLATSQAPSATATAVQTVVVQLPPPLPAPPATPLPPPSPLAPQAGQCVLLPNTNAEGDVITNLHGQASIGTCCKACQQTFGCNVFVFCSRHGGW